MAPLTLDGWVWLSNIPNFTVPLSVSESTWLSFWPISRWPPHKWQPTHKFPSEEEEPLMKLYWSEHLEMSVKHFYGQKNDWKKNESRVLSNWSVGIFEPKLTHRVRWYNILKINRVLLGICRLPRLLESSANATQDEEKDDKRKDEPIHLPAAEKGSNKRKTHSNWRWQVKNWQTIIELHRHHKRQIAWKLERQSTLWWCLTS